MLEFIESTWMSTGRDVADTDQYILVITLQARL